MSKETFDFSEALRRMKEGKWVKRHEQCVGYSINNNDIIARVFHSDGSFVKITKEVYMFVVSFILATDWEEVEG